MNIVEKYFLYLGNIFREHCSPLTNCCTRLFSQMHNKLHCPSYPRLFGAVPNTRHSLPQTPIARCRKAMRDMAVRKAASALMSTEPTVLSSTETCLKMQELHPSAKIPPQVQLRGSLPIPENLTEVDIRRALRSISFHSAPGPDGLRPAIFKCLAHAPADWLCFVTNASTATFLRQWAPGSHLQT